MRYRLTPRGDQLSNADPAIGLSRLDQAGAVSLGSGLAGEGKRFLAGRSWIRCGMPVPPATRNGRGGCALRPGEIEIREGDRLIFTASDTKRGMTNGTAVTLVAIEGGTLHLSGRERDHVIGLDDLMRERLGHGAVLNMHRAQGVTVDRAITVMDSRDRLLNSRSLHYVLQTRAREDMSLHTNNRVALAEAIEAHRGDVPHAIDLAPELTVSAGERFDPATGELPLSDDPLASDRGLLATMSEALRKVGRETTPPVREASPQTQGTAQELTPKEPDIDLEYDMDM
ncbi:hypothetical protein SAMN05192583_3163 [Sphingomonas gellani]|uniref:Uncharacterized protein n=1 Tax=Sphingomonas gellani TaxID=1166340 RepID=A0A1H8I0M9_9SPHN|nr:hypothetical protein [Sphingomonas gellani]SEN61814.1 hypothetical protein SAMN05192583_3163 [Sphingomonas gellani]